MEISDLLRAMNNLRAILAPDQPIKVKDLRRIFEEAQLIEDGREDAKTGEPDEPFDW